MAADQVGDFFVSRKLLIKNLKRGDYISTELSEHNFLQFLQLYGKLCGRYYNLHNTLDLMVFIWIYVRNLDFSLTVNLQHLTDIKCNF